MTQVLERTGDPLQWLHTLLISYPERTLLEIPNRVSVSYRKVYALSGRLAAALASRGVVAGDRVTVQVDKSVESVALYIACLRIGAVYVPLNTGYKPAELEYFLTDSQPRIFVVRPQDVDAAASVALRTQVSAVETLGVAADGTLMALANERSPGDFHPFAGSPEELAAIIYTSGTTGRSKGAMLTRGNLYSNATSLARIWRFTCRDVLLHALPLFHAHGAFISINTVLASGSSIILLPKFDVQEVTSLLPQCTVLMGVPTFYTRLLQYPGFTRKQTQNMRLFISGSAPLLRETQRQFEDKTGHFIVERYGMTETLIITAASADGVKVAGSVGRALPGIELRLTDPATGASLQGPTAVGVIELRGPRILGYWHNPEKTAAEFTDDGYFSTGDFGRIDADGNVYIVGRAKDLVITGGYNVYPMEVENEIDRVPGVAESAVVGVPHPDFGEGVTAVVIRVPGATVDEKSIHDAVSQRLATYKLPKRILIVEELPRNALGKVQKNLLREKYADLYTSKS